jgi:hypothetical protein
VAAAAVAVAVGSVEEEDGYQLLDQMWWAYQAFSAKFSSCRLNRSPGVG